MKKITYNYNGITVVDENSFPEVISWDKFELLLAKKREEYFRDVIFIDCILKGGRKYTLKFPCDTRDPIYNCVLFILSFLQSYQI